MHPPASSESSRASDSRCVHVTVLCVTGPTDIAAAVSLPQSCLEHDNTSHLVISNSALGFLEKLVPSVIFLSRRQKG